MRNQQPNQAVKENTAKTLEQLAEHDAKRSAIIEKKQKREIRKKIILGVA